VKRINTVEAVKQSAMTIRSFGRFTKSIWKMWVKDRTKSKGSSDAGSDNWTKNSSLGYSIKR